jgi:hypothetical protein
MPASHDETLDIVRIMSRYLPQDKLEELSADLYAHVGERTDNESLAVTLRQLRDVIHEDPENIFDKGNRQGLHYLGKPGGLRTYADAQR